MSESCHEKVNISLAELVGGQGFHKVQSMVYSLTTVIGLSGHCKVWQRGVEVIGCIGGVSGLCQNCVRIMSEKCKLRCRGECVILA